MFLNPIILALLGAAVIPVVLHLLSRARQQSRTWGAMQFLGGQAPRRTGPRRLRTVLVLSLRCLAILLLVLAMARPVTTPPELLAHPALARAAVALVVDTSGSTTAPMATGATRLDAVKESASRVLASLAPGDSVALLAPASPPPNEPPAFTTDLEAVSARLAALRATSARLDAAAAIEAAATLVSGQAAATRVVVLVTDRQMSTFASLDAAFAGRWQETRRRLGITRLVLVPSGLPEPGNVAIASVATAGPLLAGRPTEVTVTVRNDTPHPRSGHAVSLSAPGLETLRAEVDLAGHAAATARFSVAFPEEGMYVLTAAGLAATAGPGFDDRRDLVVRVEGAIPVLLASDVPPESCPTALALAPFADAGLNPSRIYHAAPGRLPVFDLPRFRAVVLPHLFRLSEAEALALRQYVYAGGALLVGIGPLSDAAAVARLDALLPGDVGPASPADGRAWRVEALPGHPISAFARDAADILPDASVFRFRGLSPRPGARALLTLPTPGTPAPLLLERRFGSGLVLCWGIPLAGSWSDIERSAGYVPLLQSAVRYAAAAGDIDLNLPPGTPALIPLPQGVEPGSLVLSGPDNAPAPFSLERQGATLLARFPPASIPGIHGFRFRSGGAEHVIPVNVVPDPAESDLSFDAEALARIARSLTAELIQPDIQPGAPLSGIRHGFELWPLLLTLALLCLLAELLLARRWIPR